MSIKLDECTYSNESIADLWSFGKDGLKSSADTPGHNEQHRSHLPIETQHSHNICVCCIIQAFLTTASTGALQVHTHYTHTHTRLAAFHDSEPSTCSRLPHRPAKPKRHSCRSSNPKEFWDTSPAMKIRLRTCHAVLIHPCVL